MAMIKTLSKVGSSYSLIIDKALLQVLDIEPDTLLEIKTDGKSLIITPTAPSPPVLHKASPAVQKAFESSVDQYKEVYEKLAQ